MSKSEFKRLNIQSGRPMMEPFRLYDWAWIASKNPGYVVFRDSPDRKASKEEYAEAHRVAFFVQEDEAENYCEYRNFMTGKYDTDDISMITDYSFVEQYKQDKLIPDPVVCTMDTKYRIPEKPSGDNNGG